MKLYEGLFLFDANLAAKDWPGLEKHVGDLLQKNEADLVYSERWPDRKLAYEVKGCRKGTYFLTYFNAPGPAITTLHRDVQLSERVLRLMVLQNEYIEEVLDAHKARQAEREAAAKASEAATEPAAEKAAEAKPAEDSPAESPEPAEDSPAESPEPAEATPAERPEPAEGQLAEGAISQVEIQYAGEIAGINVAPLTISVLKGLLERSQNLLGDPRGREVAVDLVEKHRELPATHACHQVRAAGTLHQAATDSTEHPLHFA